MSNEIIATPAQFELHDRTLIKYTAQIMRLGVNIRKSFLKVARILSIIDEKELYAREDGNFASTAEYAERVLGIKKSQTNNMVRVGRVFVDGNSGESILPHDDTTDYNLSQLVVLLPLKDVDKVKELAENGTISPLMTVKQLKDAIAPFKPERALGDGGEDTAEDAEGQTVHADAADVAEIAYERVETVTIERKPSGEYVAFVDDVSMSIEDALAHLAQYK